MWLGGADANLQPDGHNGKTLTQSLTLQPGQTHDFVLVLDAGLAEHGPPDPEYLWQGTASAWSDNVPRLRTTAAQRDARHAYAVLSRADQRQRRDGRRRHHVAPRARPARPQLRLPLRLDPRPVLRRPGRRRGRRPPADGRRRALRRRPAARPTARSSSPPTPITGGAVPDERTLDLPGYPGGTDIVGNWVNQQFQLDAFGEALLLFAAAARHDHLDADAWRAAETAVGAIEQRWHEPDAGIWEIDARRWTHSRLICAAGLRAISHHGPARQQAARWVSLADTIVADTAIHALHASGRWQRSPDDAALDAALLLPAIRGAIPADDPRSLATLHARRQRADRGRLLYRYRPDERPLGESEGAFLLCGFWMALAYAQQGHHVAAARWFERNRAACGPPGLFSEEFDVTQRQLRGNLPQAFVHALLLECAATLATRPGDEGFDDQ